jgi:hypothetical protein
MPPASFARAGMKESIVAKAQMGEWLVAQARLETAAFLGKVGAEVSPSLGTAQVLHGSKTK